MYAFYSSQPFKIAIQNLTVRVRKCASRYN